MEAANSVQKSKERNKLTHEKKFNAISTAEEQRRKKSKKKVKERQKSLFVV
jgi:hypothetical protein